MSSLLLAATLVLRGATVHTATGPAIPNGVIVVEGTRIVAVGGPQTPVPDDATVVDLTGRHLSPALIAPASVVGLAEIPAVRASVDVTEIGAVNPEVRPEVAMNLDSAVLPVTRSGGVLYAALTPGGSVLPGAASVVALEGYTREDACVRCPAAMVLEWPRMAIDRSPSARVPARRQERERDEALARIRQTFRDARAFRIAKAARATPGLPAHDEDAPLAALVPVLEGKLPLLVRADDKRQIEAVLRFLDEELAGDPVRVVLLGGHDALLLASRLAERKIPVIVDGVLTLPRRTDEPYDEPFALAGRLAHAGLAVAIGNGSRPGAAAATRDLPHHAAMAAAFGLEPLAALQAITLVPARIFGVDEKLGSLAAGKLASFAVWTGDPLEVSSSVVALYKDGQRLDLDDRQKRLYERYKNRPRPAAKTP